ncbi:hypothetical protein EYF80_056500 [Liparis tanakae]|uniref:Uncharacterized protein n=1 Tax=Liparis tanakae TaxID=230148 RepID=A0A4Z2EXK9_9TELE|nr:hypothetical protein EYF80_056500 [Liparis tanakae]
MRTSPSRQENHKHPEGNDEQRIEGRERREKRRETGRDGVRERDGMWNHADLSVTLQVLK